MRTLAMKISEIIAFLIDNNVSLENGLSEDVWKQLPYKDYNDIILINNRLRNNQLAEKNEWSIAHYGEVYEIRYTPFSYIYIERNDDETVDAYRCRFGQKGQADRVKYWGRNINFDEAVSEITNYLDWFYKQNPRYRKDLYS